MLTQEEEINEVIKKHMSAQVGENLKALLDQGKKDADFVKSQAEQIKRLDIEIKQKSGLIEEYKRLDERNSKLEEREKSVAEKERNQKVFEAELKLAEAEKRITDNVNFVGMVFKSPVFRKVTDQPTYSSYNAAGQYSISGGGRKEETQITE